MTDTTNGNAPMTCPDWRRLAAARDSAPGDPAGWEEALTHLDACTACRRAAVEADPTLLFRRLSPVAVGADEAEAMRLRVATLRGAQAVAGSRQGLELPFHGRRLRRVWQPVAAAAALAVAVLAGGHSPAGAPRADLGARRAAAPALPPELSAELAAQPLLEELDQPYDHVVQWNAEDVSVVLVVDERLDV